MEVVVGEMARVEQAEAAMWSTVDAKLDGLVEMLESGTARSATGLATALKATQSATVAKQKDMHSALTRLSKAIDKAALAPAVPAIPQTTPTKSTASDLTAGFLASNGSPVAPDVHLNDTLLRKAVAQHFLREGEFELAEVFAADCARRDGSISAANPAAVNPEPFREMFAVLRAMQQKNLAPAIAWARAHRAKAEEAASRVDESMDISPPAFENNGDDQEATSKSTQADGSDLLPRRRLRRVMEQPYQQARREKLASTKHLNAVVTAATLEFRLHSMEFLNRLESKGKIQALQYARQNLSPLVNHGTPLANSNNDRTKSENMVELQKLMGCLMFEGRLDRSPYASLASATRHDDLQRAFAKESCCALGMSEESALEVLVSAGTLALPTLIKAARIRPPGGSKPSGTDEPFQLPVEIHLGDKYQFHSIFACPVSRDESSKDNPPMILPCGHVLCKNSINRLPRGNARFKCAYCPSEQSPDQCQIINF